MRSTSSCVEPSKAPSDRPRHASPGCVALERRRPRRAHCDRAPHQHCGLCFCHRAGAGAADQPGQRVDTHGVSRCVCIQRTHGRLLIRPDARFDVLGTPFSLLSVSLSASQTLYTRRGTLVSLSGKPENTLSTLSVLEPIRRAPVGIPFLYQKISSTSPVTALICTKSPISSIVSVNLDGRQDWLISQRQALLAWTGHSLTLKPQYNAKLGLAHWGNTYVTGRGLMALAGSGQIYQVQIKEGETYVAHPRHVADYHEMMVVR